MILKWRQFTKASGFTSLIAIGCFLSACTINPSKEDMDDWRNTIVSGAAMIDFVFILILLSPIVFIFLRTVLAKKSITVFIVYQHMLEKTAKEIMDNLINNGLILHFLPYEPRDYDQTIISIENKIKKSDVVIAIPSTERSFIDAEIYHARALRKPIIFIKCGPANRLPDTALSGYPVFNLDALHAYNLKPLVRFIFYLCNHWSDIFNNVLRAIPEMIVGLCLGAVIPIAFLLYHNFIRPIVALFSVGVSLKVGYASIVILLSFILITLVTGFLFGLWTKHRSSQVARQTIISGSLTKEILETGLGYLPKDQEILRCIASEFLRRGTS